MDKNYFVELLNKYRAGEATQEECRFILSYYELFENEPDVLNSLSSSEKESLKHKMSDLIWESIHQHEVSKVEVKQKAWPLTMLKIAAVLLILVSTGLYFYKEAPETGQPRFAKKESHRNGHRLVRLPDGSTVIIGAGSKLDYPSSFDGLAKREVYLEGQAYFDVKHSSVKPFIIHTGNLTTTVLGTAFNISAWPGDAELKVTVSRGKVKVEDENKMIGIITPNEQITYNKENALATKATVEVAKYLVWKEEDLYLDDVTLAEAAELLEGRFNVNIEIADEQLKTKRFSTTFLKDESLSKVLTSICEFNDASYYYDKENKLVTVSRRLTQ